MEELISFYDNLPQLDEQAVITLRNALKKVRLKPNQRISLSNNKVLVVLDYGTVSAQRIIKNLYNALYGGWFYLDDEIKVGGNSRSFRLVVLPSQNVESFIEKVAQCVERYERRKSLLLYNLEVALLEEELNGDITPTMREDNRYRTLISKFIRTV